MATGAAAIKSIDQLLDQRELEERRPSLDEAEEAVRVLIRWIGDTPSRKELVDTPNRFVHAYKEMFSGYDTDPKSQLERTFEAVDGYDEPVILQDINFASHCECHMMPITGRAHIAYLPTDRVLGISKLVRLVEVYSRRLQTQERLTNEIATTLESALHSEGVGVAIKASHACLALDGVGRAESLVVTQCLLGAIRDDPELRLQFRRSTGGLT